MNHNHPRDLARWWRLVSAALALLGLGACSSLGTAAAPPPAFYSLDSAGAVGTPSTTAADAPTLVVNPPRAAAGFDSQRIIYVRESHQLEYFAHSQWVEPPARMLGPLLVAALEKQGVFRAVVLAAGSAAGDLRLDSEVIRLQHDFQTRPSRVTFALRAALVDDKTRRVLAVRQFDAAVSAASEDPYGGVVAANRAVQLVLEDLAIFCMQSATGLRAGK